MIRIAMAIAIAGGLEGVAAGGHCGGGGGESGTAQGHRCVALSLLVSLVGLYYLLDGSTVTYTGMLHVHVAIGGGGGSRPIF